MTERKFYYPIGRKKVAIVGAGYVGASIAYALTLRDLAQEIVLIDLDTNKAWGEATDIQHGIPYMGECSVRVGEYADCADCDLIIITAGRNRRPGETRLNMISDNRKIMEGVVAEIKKYYTHSVIMVVSNPVDVMVSLCAQGMGLPDGMVFGTGCTLDTSRMIRVIADYVGLNTAVINGYIVGEHGDSQIPLWSRLSVGGITMGEYCASVGLPWTAEERARIAEEVRTMGASIISAKGKTHYGIATCVCLLADAVLNQRPTIASVSTPLQGEYGVSGVALSVPSIIGGHGVERRIQENWAPEELAAFRESACRVRKALQ